VITGFADRRTRSLFGRERVKGLSGEIQRTALRKLLILDAAARIEDLRIPPGNGWRPCRATCGDSTRFT
jgi:proteic killer suppression protein